MTVDKSPRRLILDLAERGISLRASGDKLAFTAPRGVLTEDQRNALRQAKPEILAELTARENASIVSDPANRHLPFPLTDIQAAYLVGRNEAYDWGGVACQIYMELSYGDLDPKRVEEAWRRLIDRHEMLRCVIDAAGSQRILNDVGKLSIPCGEGLRHLEEQRAALSNRLGDPGVWPLFAVATTQLPDRAVMHFSMEFIIADWTSIWMLLREFEAEYFTPEIPLPEIRLSFRDYIDAHQRIRSTVDRDLDQLYWKGKLDHLPPAPHLPILASAQRKGRGCFRRYNSCLPMNEWNAFRRRSRKWNLTPTAVILTAYAKVLERWNDRPDLTLNLTALNRPGLHPEIGNIMGDFTQNVLVETDFTRSRSFREEAQATLKTLFDNLDHQSFTGVEVLRDLANRFGREAAFMPYVFTSAIGLQNNDQSLRLRGRIGEGISQTPQVFIDCQVMDTNDELLINWDVREGVFQPGIIEDCFTAFMEFLHELAAGDESWERKGRLPLPAWQLRVREQVNDTTCPLPHHLLHETVIAQARNFPDRMAIADGRDITTYGELMTQAAGIAASLRELGILPGQRVGVGMTKNALQMAACLAVLSVGGCYVPMDADGPDKRNRGIVAATQMACVLTTSADEAPWMAETTVVHVEGLRGNPDELSVEGDEKNIAYIIFTSGSTGEPKGVAISHRAAVNTIEDINQRFSVTSEDRILGLSRLNFDLSVYDLFGVLSVGGAVIHPEPRNLTNPIHWAELIQEWDVTLWNSVPALMQLLVDSLEESNNKSLNSLRAVLLSGDWIPLALPERIQQVMPEANIVSLGGATEASIWSIHYPWEGNEPHWVSIPYGKPLLNQGFHVLDDRLYDCPVGVPGQLAITGVGLADGYIGDPALTAKQFPVLPQNEERAYLTGDLGRYLPDGNIEFLGRRDSQVKIRGYRIELGEIEAAFTADPEVVAAAAFVVERAGEKQIQAVLQTSVPPGDILAFESSWIARLRDTLPSYMIPRRVGWCPRFPLTSNGKVDRTALPEIISHSPENLSGDPEKPLTSTQMLVSDTCRELLEIDKLGLDESLYDVGADSMTMNRIAIRLSESPGCASTFEDILVALLNEATVAAVSRVIETKNDDSEVSHAD